MMKLKLCIALFCISWFPFIYGQESDSYMFRIYLKDKGESIFNTNNPEKYLSSRSIDRRLKQGIPIIQNDLPVSDEYIEIVEALNCKVVAKSKWMNTIAIVCKDSTLVNNIKVLSFVSDAKFVWKGGLNSEEARKKFDHKSKKIKYIEKDGEYGAAAKQILIHQADTLHKMGYKGENMEIAVIDAGFNGMDQEHLLLSTVSVKGSRDFVYKGESLYKSNNHGTEVLSCMGTNAPNTFVGTAPKASYWLLRSEDPRSEFPIEEDYWAAAAEYADSLGVDLINTSLGYSRFDDPAQSYTYNDMDGKTAYITQASEIAASKGIVVILSAGNDGAKPWKYITAPGDSNKGLTVGAINSDSILASFSSRGPTFDGRLKPDVVAVGQNTTVINQLSEIISASGTSFSAPVMCGIAACFWQANPHLTSDQVVEALKQSSNRWSNPDNNYGYGIPNIPRALEIVKTTTEIENIATDRNANFKVRTNTKNSTIKIIKEANDFLEFSVQIYNIKGENIIYRKSLEKEIEIELPKEQHGIFILKLQDSNKIECFKIAL